MLWDERTSGGSPEDAHWLLHELLWRRALRRRPKEGFLAVLAADPARLGQVMAWCPTPPNYLLIDTGPLGLDDGLAALMNGSKDPCPVAADLREPMLAHLEAGEAVWLAVANEVLRVKLDRDHAREERREAEAERRREQAWRKAARQSQDRPAGKRAKPVPRDYMRYQSEVGDEEEEEEEGEEEPETEASGRSSDAEAEVRAGGGVPRHRAKGKGRAQPRAPHHAVDLPDPEARGGPEAGGEDMAEAGGEDLEEDAGGEDLEEDAGGEDVVEEEEEDDDDPAYGTPRQKPGMAKRRMAPPGLAPPRPSQQLHRGKDRGRQPPPPRPAGKRLPEGYEQRSLWSRSSARPSQSSQPAGAPPGFKPLPKRAARNVLPADTPASSLLPADSSTGPHPPAPAAQQPSPGAHPAQPPTAPVTAEGALAARLSSFDLGVGGVHQDPPPPSV
jgi:hypothetical protein